MSPVFSLTHQDADLSLAILGGTLLSVWRNRMSAEHARMQNHLAEAQLKKRPTVGALVFIEESVVPPTEEVRHILHEMAVKHPTTLLGIAVAMDGTGFRVALVRGVTTAIGMLSRGGAPSRAFATPEEAASWLEERAGGHKAGEPTVAELAAAIQSLRHSAR